MATTQQTVSYMLQGGVQGNTSGGTQYNGVVNLTITPGVDFTDADAFAIQEAILAAFPTSWTLSNLDLPLRKEGDALTTYATDYTAKTFS